MSVAEQVARAMRFRLAHGMWFSKMIYELRAGRDYTAPEPKIEDFT